MASTDVGTHSRMIKFLVAAGFVFEVVAAMCSSPQTAEINSDRRASTLMKWVIIGLAVSLLFVAVAVYLDDEKWPSILGGALAGGAMWVAYDYAKKSGLKSTAPGTEH
jgi:hypothetical protein